MICHQQIRSARTSPDARTMACSWTTLLSISFSTTSSRRFSRAAVERLAEDLRAPSPPVGFPCLRRGQGMDKLGCSGSSTYLRAVEENFLGI
eukprot:746660-Hanusia_phi.AAC.5